MPNASRFSSAHPVAAWMRWARGSSVVTTRVLATSRVGGRPPMRPSDDHRVRVGDHGTHRLGHRSTPLDLGGVDEQHASPNHRLVHRAREDPRVVARRCPTRPPPGAAAAARASSCPRPRWGGRCRPPCTRRSRPRRCRRAGRRGGDACPRARARTPQGPGGRPRPERCSAFRRREHSEDPPARRVPPSAGSPVRSADIWRSVGDRAIPGACPVRPCARRSTPTASTSSTSDARRPRPSSTTGVISRRSSAFAGREDGPGHARRSAARDVRCSARGSATWPSTA